MAAVSHKNTKVEGGAATGQEGALGSVSEAAKGAWEKWSALVRKLTADKRQLDIIEQKTGIDRVYVVTVVASILFLGAMGAFGGSPVSNLIGFVYPTYRSYKAIKSDNKDDDTQWLTYWVVYSFFIVIESFTDVLMSWIPLYYFAKIAFLLGCMSPVVNGSSYMFNRFIEPALDMYSTKVDKMEDSVMDKFQEAASDIRDEVTQRGTEYIAQQMVQGAQRSDSPQPGDAVPVYGSDDEPSTAQSSETDDDHPKSL